MSGFYFTPKTLNKTVATAGTRVQLFASSTPCRSCTIEANPANTGVIYVGDATVSSSVYGLSISKGNSYTFSCDGNDSKLDLTDIWLDCGTSGDGVSVFYF